MLRKYAAIVAALMVCAPIGGSADSAMGSYGEQIHDLQPAAQWPPGQIELVLLCCCLVVLCLIAPRFLSSLTLPKMR
jgi:hypothetical protein